MRASLLPRVLAGLFAVAAFVASSGGYALAQVQGQGGTPQVQLPGGPYRGLFGGNNGAAGRGQALDLTFSLYGAYDDNVLAGERGSGSGPGDPRFQESGYFLGSSLGLAYMRTLPRGTFTAGAASFLRYYIDRDDPVSPSLFANVGYSAALGTRTFLSTVGMFRYLPYYRYGVLPGPAMGLPEPTTPIASDIGVDLPLPDDDLVVIDRQSTQWFMGIDLSRRVTQRSTLTALYGYGLTDFSDTEGDQRRHRAGAGYSYRLMRDLSLRVRYMYQRRWYQGEGVEPFEAHNVDGGVDYSRTFRLGNQRTQLSFSTGTTMFTRQELDSTGVENDRFTVQFIGSANLFHQLSRTWSTQATYRRSVRFLDGFEEPALADTVSASLGGYLNERFDLVFLASYSSGAIGTHTRNYDTALASARLQYALFANLAAFAQYFFYHYTFDESVDLPLGYLPGQDRQGVRIGVNCWFPLLR